MAYTTSDKTNSPEQISPTTKTNASKADPSAVYQELHQNADGGPEVLTSPPVIGPSIEKPKENLWIGQSFANRIEAEQAYQMLIDRGYKNDEINVLMSKDTQQRYFSEEDTTAIAEKAQEGTVADVGKGAMQGAMIGTLLALGTNIVLPGVGLFLGGPIFIGGGALMGGVNKYLTESGIPEDQATAYENEVKNGRIILGVSPHNEADLIYLKEAWGKS